MTKVCSKDALFTMLMNNESLLPHWSLTEYWSEYVCATGLGKYVYTKTTSVRATCVGGSALCACSLRSWSYACNWSALVCGLGLLLRFIQKVFFFLTDADSALRPRGRALLGRWNFYLSNESYMAWCDGKKN